MKHSPTTDKVDQYCGWCGDRFSADRVDVKRGWGKYCSSTCENKHKLHKANSHSRQIIYKRKKERENERLLAEDEE